LNEWVKLMLEEVRRKAREREEALQEHKRRQPGAQAGTQSGASGETPEDAAHPRPADRTGRD
jgi:hypothetical protein